MISRILLVSAIALVSYVLLPSLGQLWVTNRWKRILKQLKSTAGMTGFCTGFTEGQLEIQTTNSEVEHKISILPKKTKFLILRNSESPEILNWKTLHLLQAGTTLYFVSASKPYKSNICIFYEEKNSSLLVTRIRTLPLPENTTNHMKAYCVALGAFAEFLLFLEFVRTPELYIATIAALVAIFGKALPYCPPGLFFTLASLIPGKKQENQKKSRKRNATGILLISTGVILNIAVIFFIIRNIGF